MTSDGEGQHGPVLTGDEEQDSAVAAPQQIKVYTTTGSSPLCFDCTSYFARQGAPSTIGSSTLRGGDGTSSQQMYGKTFGDVRVVCKHLLESTSPVVSVALP